jgi:hypothetical protein
MDNHSSTAAGSSQQLLFALVRREQLRRASLRSLARIERFTSEFPQGHPLLPALFLHHCRRRCLLEQVCAELEHCGGRNSGETHCSICLARDPQSTTGTAVSN